jgi:hypothetical protein
LTYKDKKTFKCNAKENIPTTITVPFKHMRKILPLALTEVQTHLKMPLTPVTRAVFVSLNLDMARAVESIILTLPQTLGIEFRWKIRATLEKSKFSMPNMIKRTLNHKIFET